MINMGDDDMPSYRTIDRTRNKNQLRFYICFSIHPLRYMVLSFARLSENAPYQYRKIRKDRIACCYKVSIIPVLKVIVFVSLSGFILIVSIKSAVIRSITKVLQVQLNLTTDVVIIIM